MDKQSVIEETEKALDVIETKLDSIEEIENVVAKNKVVSSILIGAGVVLVAASSAFAGYKFAQRKLKAQYEELATQEIEEAKAFYGRLYKTTDKLATPEEAFKDAVEAAEAEEPTEAQLLQDAVKAVSSNYETSTKDPVDYSKINKVAIDEEVAAGTLVIEETTRVEVATNVFTDANLEHWDYEREVAKRTPDVPYIITEEEFLQNDPSHAQSSLTYFEKDDILLDAVDQIIQDQDGIVGDDNLVRFGKGSKHPNIVFVRNERIETDFEIERSSGSYVEEVAGLRDDSEDAGRTPRKFRSGDDG